MHIKKTSVSLPKRLIEHLETARFAWFSCEQLAMACLRRYLKGLRIEEFDTRGTCRYNNESCEGRLYIWLRSEDAHTLKAHRYVRNVSVSFMLSQAVDKYLVSVVRTLKKMYVAQFHVRARRWYKALRETLCHIHRKVRFSYPYVCGMSITISRPKQNVSRTGHGPPDLSG